MDYIEAQRICYSHICSICGNEPVIYIKERGEIEVRCQNKEHQGFTRLKGYRQTWREGQAIPIHIANRIENKEDKDG